MLWPFQKNLCSITLVIFLIIVFGGLILSPSFFLFEKVQAENFQSSVTITVCGNEKVEGDEECDDGNLDNTDSCLNTCLDASCGDGYLWSGVEECDDGNTVSGDGCSSSCKTEVPARPPPTGGGGGTVPPLVETKVIIQGKAYPSSLITVLKDGKIALTTKADARANFKVEISNITAGIYTFGVWAEDSKKRRSITFTFTTFIRSKTITTIGGIFIPPTIELSKVGLQRGETLNILGQTAPKSEISIFISSPGEGIVKKTEAELDGTWFYAFDTTPLEEGSHTSQAKAVCPEDLLSSFSKLLSFYIGGEAIHGLCPGADFNKDSRVNLVDFSILLYWWGKVNSCVDQNQNGIVNITDFSIMLYYWTG